MLSTATQGAATEWKLQEGNTIDYKIETLLLNGTRHANEISNDYFSLHDVSEGDFFTLRVGEIVSSAEACEWKYSISTGGREVSSTMVSSDHSCKAGTGLGLGMIFPVDNREHYEMEIVPNISTHSRDTNRTANLIDVTLEIIEENQSYTVI
ncbi:MAG: hypothetical protein ACFFB3_07075 [Candidatus Hodarchaeota archaeon]